MFPPDSVFPWPACGPAAARSGAAEQEELQAEEQGENMGVCPPAHTHRTATGRLPFKKHFEAAVSCLSAAVTVCRKTAGML